jgi:NAD(P)-dependent dehydrogenase (short-subunit alcohol dehydrogenase family)
VSIPHLDGRVALVTGGAQGIGAAAARRLAAAGSRVVVADVDAQQGAAVAEETGGLFVACDVSRLEDNQAAVAAAVEHYGGLDIAFLNAGIATTDLGVGDDFDVQAYRRAMGINLDGVFFGVHAALPALRERGGAAVVLTASLAGLTGVPADPVYCANKHAVVGLARALGPALAGERITVNALCPGFADTAINDPVRELIAGAGIPMMSADDVAAVFMDILASEETGQAWYVQPGRPGEPFAFRNIPGPRAADGSPVGGPLPSGSAKQG